MASENDENAAELSVRFRVSLCIAGLACFSAAFAIFGLAFDFLDMTIRDDWPRWLVFATFPLICISVMLVFGLGGILIATGFAPHQRTASERNEDHHND